MKHYLLLTSCFFSLNAFASQTLTFFDLDKPNVESYFDKEVTIVGFLACNEQKEWFLARQPNIKSCCLKKQLTVRLGVEISSDQKNQVVRVEGILQKEQDDFVLTKCRFLGRSD